MTACTNNGGSRARRAVTAALVGVLSVGAAPMVALATGAADTGVQLMATTSQEAFSKGVVTAQDGMGGDVTFPEKDLVSFTDESESTCSRPPCRGTTTRSTSSEDRRR